MNTFLYRDSPIHFNLQDAEKYSLRYESNIYATWQKEKYRQSCLKCITCGLANFWLKPMMSRNELDRRIAMYRQYHKKVDRLVRVVQRRFAEKIYQKQNERFQTVKNQAEYNLANGIGRYFDVVSVWIKRGEIDLRNGARGQIIWHRSTELAKRLRESGFYVFYHAHSYPITLHLELATHFSSLHQSQHFAAIKPLQSRRKFRAEGVARHFANTTAYLASDLGKQINQGNTIDDRHRETIISCDSIEENKEAWESCQHFFKTNSSVVDTPTSTGMKPEGFDKTFIQSYLRTVHFQKMALDSFSIARGELKSLPGYGMIRLIAIDQETIKNPETNYVWRSHAFGRLCTCAHSIGKYGHDEFVQTLEKHQKRSFSRCVKNGKIPQYRILAANLDRDIKKQIYNMDCLTEAERQTFDEIFNRLFQTLSHLYQLERIGHLKSYRELFGVLCDINPNEFSSDYRLGIQNIFLQNKELLQAHKKRLQIDLPKNLHYILSWL